MTTAITAPLHPLQPDRRFSELAEMLQSRAEQNAVVPWQLPEKLTAAQREVLSVRRNTIEAASIKAKRSDVGPFIDQLMMAFGKAANLEEAAVFREVYWTVLQGLPLFAIRQACLRFMNGGVSPEEIGEKTLSKSFVPSTANLRTVADKIVEPYRREIYVAKKLLDAKVAEPEPSPEQRERGIQILREAAAGIKRRADEATFSRDSEGEERAMKRMKESAEQSVIREYKRAGVTPEKGADGIIISLPVLISLGWKIQEIGIERVLVAPPPRPKGPIPQRRTEST